MKKLALTALALTAAFLVASAPNMVEYVSAATQTGNNTQTDNNTVAPDPDPTPGAEVADELLDIFEKTDSASEAAEAVANSMDKDALKEAMKANAKVLDLMTDLEKIYVVEKGITVGAPAVSDEVSAVVKAGDISVVGAGLNVEAGNVQLTVGKPVELVEVPDASLTKAVQLNIQLMNGETSVHDLKLPVTLTMKAPAGLDVNKLVILHYTANGVETIVPVLTEDNSIRFSVTSFSTFVFAEKTDDSADNNNDSSSDNGGSSGAASDVDFQGAVVSVDWSAAESAVNNALQNAAGQNVNLFVGKEFEVPVSLLNKLAGKNVTLALQTGSGLAFSVSGADVKNADAALKIHMSERVAIPDDVRKTVLAGAKGGRVFGMDTKAAFPYAVNVHVNLGKENAGKMAYLYYYDEATKSMKLSGSFKVTEAGQAMFAVNRGDEYIAVVSDTVLQSAGNYTVVPGDTLSRIAAKNGVALRNLIAANPQIKDSNRIYPGQTIIVR